MSALPPKADIRLCYLRAATSGPEAPSAILPQCLMPDTQSWKAVLTVVGAVYGGVTLGGRHGSIPHRARIGSRGWHCFFPVRD
jgi:hypothetical protein